MRLEVLMAFKISMLVFCVVTPSWQTAVCSSETLVSTWRYNPEDQHRPCMSVVCLLLSSLFKPKFCLSIVKYDLWNIFISSTYPQVMCHIWSNGIREEPKRLKYFYQFHISSHVSEVMLSEKNQKDCWCIKWYCILER
jgi:hypothetical protein